MSSLQLRGWALLNDLAVPGRRVNIDHVLIGPAGVLVLDSKNFSGRVTARAGTLWHNQFPLNREIEGLRSYAEVVCRALGPLQSGVPVHAVMCIHNAAVDGFIAVSDCAVLGASELRAWISQLEEVVPLRSVPILRNAIAGQLPSRTSTGGALSAADGSSWSSTPVTRPTLQVTRPETPAPTSGRSTYPVPARNRARRGTKEMLTAFGLITAVLASVMFVKSVSDGLATGGASSTTRLSPQSPAAPASDPITGSFSCQATGHEYLLTASSPAGALRIVDEQDPRGVTEQTWGSTYVPNVRPGEQVQLSLVGSNAPLTVLSAPAAAC